MNEIAFEKLQLTTG